MKKEKEINKLASLLIDDVFNEIKPMLLEEAVCSIKNSLFGKLGQRKYKVSEDIIDKAQKLHKEGVSYVNIGKQFGVSRQAVWNWINK